MEGDALDGEIEFDYAGLIALHTRGNLIAETSAFETGLAGLVALEPQGHGFGGLPTPAPLPGDKPHQTQGTAGEIMSNQFKAVGIMGAGLKKLLC